MDLYTSSPIKTLEVVDNPLTVSDNLLHPKDPALLALQDNQLDTEVI